MNVSEAVIEKILVFDRVRDKIHFKSSGIPLIYQGHSAGKFKIGRKLIVYIDIALLFGVFGGKLFHMIFDKLGCRLERQVYRGWNQGNQSCLMFRCVRKSDIVSMAGEIDTDLLTFKLMRFPLRVIDPSNYCNIETMQ